MNLKPETLARIDEVITHYPVKRSAVLMLLHAIQEDLGYISPAAVEWVAARLELQPINVQEVVSFYPMFRQKPIGRRHIKVCRTLSCALMGGYKTCAAFEKEFNTKLGATSPDGEVTVELVKLDTPLAPAGKEGSIRVDGEPVGPRMGHIVLRRGHQGGKSDECQGGVRPAGPSESIGRQGSSGRQRHTGRQH